MITNEMRSAKWDLPRAATQAGQPPQGGSGSNAANVDNCCFAGGSADGSRLALWPTQPLLLLLLLAVVDATRKGGLLIAYIRTLFELFRRGELITE